MDQETNDRDREEFTHNLKGREAETGKYDSSLGTGSGELASNPSKADAENGKGIAKWLWKAFIIEEEFSEKRLSTPKESVDEITSSSSDDEQEATDEIANDEDSEFLDALRVDPEPEQPDLTEYLDKRLMMIFLAYEMAMSSNGTVDPEQIETCKMLVGKTFPRTTGGLEYKDYASWKNETDHQGELAWSQLSRAMGFGGGRIPSIPWPVYSRADPRLMHDKRATGYGLEFRCAYPKWHTGQSSKF